MNREEVLTKVIAIAKRNGFDISDDFFTEIPAETWLKDGQDLYYSLIFSHDFAISFFGENNIIVEDCSEDVETMDLVQYENPIALLMANRNNIKIVAWQYHLAQMVMCSDPLVYLYKFMQDHEQTESN